MSDRDILRKLGENIRNLRVSRGYSQKDFADLFDLTQAAISWFESGSREPSLGMIFRIAGKFRVPVTSLIPVEQSGMDDDVFLSLSATANANPYWPEILARGKYLSNEDTAMILSMVRSLTK